MGGFEGRDEKDPNDERDQRELRGASGRAAYTEEAREFGDALGTVRDREDSLPPQFICRCECMVVLLVW